MSSSKTSIFAALEGFIAFMACMYAFAVSKSMLMNLSVPAQAREHLSGLGQSVAAAAVLCAMYGQRMRPRQSYKSAVLDTAASLARSLNLRISPVSIALLFAHVAQIGGVLAFTPGYREAWPGAALHCADATKLVWAPLFEELAFRVVVFSVVLQRTGGDLRLTLSTTALMFACIHLPNAFATFTGGNNVPRAYVYLQVVSAAAVGAYLSCAFALSGSVVEVALLHAANNAAAVVWMGRDALLGGPEAAECKPAVTSELLVALAGQVALYAVAASVAWGQLSALTGTSMAQSLALPDDTAGQAAQGQQAALAVSPANSFKARHPIVYGGSTGADGAPAQRAGLADSKED